MVPIGLQVEVAEASSAAARTASCLWEVCALLPQGAAPSGSSLAGSSLASRAAEVDSGRDAWLWAAAADMETAPATPDASAVHEAAALKGSPATCGVELEALLALAGAVVAEAGAGNSGSKGRSGRAAGGTQLLIQRLHDVLSR